MAGKYAPSEAMVACSDCETGYRSDLTAEGRKACVQYTAGKYLSATNLDVCEDCVAGETSQVASTECMKCRPARCRLA